MIKRSVLHNKYAFYDLVVSTPTRPTQPIESIELLEKIKKLQQQRSGKDGGTRVFEGNYKLDRKSAQERINRIFGGRIKGEPPRSSSRIVRNEPRKVVGVLVPSKPLEPDNCCMSGCVNCVWELFNDDLKFWNAKRKEAAQHLKLQGGRWPENFDAPVQFLQPENLPESLANNPTQIGQQDESGWGNVPISIRVFAETEKRLKKKQQQQQQLPSQPSSLPQ